MITQFGFGAFVPFGLAEKAIFQKYFGVDSLDGLMVERFVKARLMHEGVQADHKASAIPLVRKYGFYHGPINPQAARKFAEDVRPFPKT